MKQLKETTSRMRRGVGDLKLEETTKRNYKWSIRRDVGWEIAAAMRKQLKETTRGVYWGRGEDRGWGETTKRNYKSTLYDLHVIHPPLETTKRNYKRDIRKDIEEVKSSETTKRNYKTTFIRDYFLWKRETTKRNYKSEEEAGSLL